jgi:hypothetical protein
VGKAAHARRKFQSQLDAVASADCFARVRSGKDSPMMIQTPGAHVVAKPTMNRHAAATITAHHGSYISTNATWRCKLRMQRLQLPAPLSVSTSRVTPTPAKTKSQSDCQSPPRMSGQRRPNFSMMYSPPNVLTKLTAPRMICVTYESEMPTLWKIVAP